MSVTIRWTAESGPKEVVIALPVTSISAVRAAVQKELGGGAQNSKFTITDASKDIETDADLLDAKDGTTWFLTFGDSGLAAPTRERISFQPHPKTLTMAGDYEYFAAQGRHPFVYALAEFIDNSLRATRRNAPHPRNITISFSVLGSGTAAPKGLICITDNGCGMTKHELNDWAVMNYSMEERGSAPQEPEVAQRGGGPGAGRFLSGDLSYFGVGSKNAAFFMGACVKVATRKAGERYVHELCLAADDLEARYRNHEAVYEEDMLHRNPGDASTLAPMEQPFPAAAGWVGEEVHTGTDRGFTRVVVGNLKAEVLEQLMDEESGRHICQELAHLYHYYLHGEGGNRDASAQPGGLLPNGEPLPDIELQYMVDSRRVWARRLVEVDDDLETRLLRAQRSELPFTLEVPNKGTVCGVLYYFPYENDHETVPLENVASSTKPIMPSPFAPTQLPVMSQMPLATQAHRQGGDGAGVSEDEEVEVAAWRAPIFEAFWQGRLIPGARIESLPFIETVRQKRSAQVKDSVPDEAFNRLRGALFFGPAFKVTRNKLLFRDNLQDVLANAVPGDRNLEKKFRDWLTRCHTTLDKSIRFEALADSQTQASWRAKVGESVTAFDRISDGARSIARGDLVRIAVKPLVLGRVVAFTIPRAVREEGSYANGRIHVEALPAAVHGVQCVKEYSLRRLDGVVDERELVEHTQRELARVPASLRLEPMAFNTGKAVEYAAGDSLPETSVTVMSAAGQKLVRAFYGGKKQSVSVTQRLWKLPHEGAQLPAAVHAGSPVRSPDADQTAAAAPAEEPAERTAKRQKKGRGKTKGKQDENADPDPKSAAKPATGGTDPISTAAPELVLSVENRVPCKDVFMFARLADGLTRAGAYALEYLVGPPIPGQEPLRLVVPLLVHPGPAATVTVSGEGRVTATLKDLALGETLPPLTVTLADEHGNRVPVSPDMEGHLRITALIQRTDTGVWERCKELTVSGEVDPPEDGSLRVSAVRVVGHKRALASRAGLDVLRHVAGAGAKVSPRAETNAQPGSQRTSIGSAPIALRFLFKNLPELEAVEGDDVPLRIRAGPAKSLVLAPGATWGDDSVLQLENGSSVPEVRVAAVDAWGNPTASTPDLVLTGSVECAALVPTRHELEFGADGVAVVTGLRAGVSTKGEEPDIVSLGVRCVTMTDGMAAAVEAVLPYEPLTLALRVVPSSIPVAVRIMRAGVLLPHETVPGDDGPSTTAILAGVEAGTECKDLQVVFLDETGALCAMSFDCRGTLSWLRKKPRNIKWKGVDTALTPLATVHVPTDVNGAATVEFVRFISTGAVPFELECGLEIRPAAAPPCKWEVQLLDQAESGCTADLGAIACGQPFTLEIAALDAYNNRCSGGAAGELPVPHIALEGDGPLQYDAASWECGWVQQGVREVYTVKLSVAGRPGAVKVIARNTATKGTAPLEEDSLTVELTPGPPAALMFEGPTTVRCSTRASLSLAVRCCDAVGNRVDPAKGATGKDRLDVLLCSSALAGDASGRAAKIAVKGGSSKARAIDGVARFAEVVATAEAPGTYTLRAQSGSRKFALEDAVLTLVMEPQNVVTALEVGVPAELRDQCHAGCSGRLTVTATTEDGQPLAVEAAAAGLLLRVTPPTGNKADVALLSLPSVEEGGPELEDGAFVFQVPELMAAGVYSVVAEYSETRADLLAAMLKKDISTRSSTAQFTVMPGPAVSLTLEAPSLPDRLAATNGDTAKQRTLLRNAAVQLRDGHGNAAQTAGVRVRFSLQAAAADIVEAAQQGTVPELAASEAAGALETDAAGRAFFGTLTLVQGSGAAPSGQLECLLSCQALGLSASHAEEDLEMDDEGWATCWRCPVLFSDDVARYAEMSELNDRRIVLTAARDAATKRIAAVRAEVSGALKEQQRATRQAASKLKAHPGAPPATAAEAEARAAQLKQALEVGPEGGAGADTTWHARYGNPRSAMTAAIETALQCGDAALVGVLAQLMTVDEPRLAQVVSASLRNLLATIVVKDGDARTRVAAAVKAAGQPVPDMLALTHANGFRGKAGPIPGFDGAGALAQALTRAASAGADRPLPVLLPHARVLAAPNAPRVPAGGLGPNDWPQGCLGFLFNLVRPVERGQRAGVLYGLLGQALVFETLAEAAAYREYTCQTLRSGMGELLTLDQGRITGRGITSGSSFAPPPLDKADYLIGSTPGGQGVNSTGDAAAELALLESLAPALQAKEETDAAVAAAQERAAVEETAAKEELAGLEREIAEIDRGMSAKVAPPMEEAEMAGPTKKRGRGREDEVIVEEEEEPQKGKTKRKRLMKMQ